MKPGIVLYSGGNSDWVGGLYYIKNIAYVISQNQWITNNYNIYIITNADSARMFIGLPEKVSVVKRPKWIKRTDKIYRILFCLTRNARLLFPCASKIKGIKRLYGVSWIPDFQHNRLIDMYEEDERLRRIRASKGIVENGNPLILSSNDCYRDLKKYYNRDYDTYVVPFVSAIKNDIEDINSADEVEVLQKYELNSTRYVYIANQFWRHKNHLIVMESIKNLVVNGSCSELIFVFTGKLRDPRSPDYIDVIKSFFDDPQISKHIINLGFINRDEQIIIMKNAEFIIQPSLFEGWGTVVEDAKVLDKTILLSDIPVHREQMNEKCILFDPHDPVALAHLIEDEIQKEHHDDIEKGIADMYKRAKEYSKGFEQLLKDLERR